MEAPLLNRLSGTKCACENGLERIKICQPLFQVVQKRFAPSTSRKPSVEAAKYQKVVLDYDAGGNRAGIDIDHGSRKLDLRDLVTNQLPLAAKA